MSEGGSQLGIELDGFGKIGVIELREEVEFLLEVDLFIGGEYFGNKFFAIDFDVIEAE